jgi:hypothetical protein
MSNPTTLDAVKAQDHDWFVVTVRPSTHKCWKVCERNGVALMDGFSSDGEARFWALQSGFLPLPKVTQ